MVNDKIGLGAWFKQVRIDRGFSLRQTASGFSAAALSRFERGQTDISQENLQTLMANLGLSATDIGAFELQGDYAFPTAIIDATIAQNVEAAKQMKNRYMRAHSGEDNNPLLPLAEKVFDMAMLPSNADYRMDSTLENRMLRMLAYPNMWGTFELALSVCCYRFASDNFIEAVWSYFQQIDFQPDTDVSVGVVWIFYAAILHANWSLVHDIRKVTLEMVKDNQKGPTNTVYTPVLHFLIDLSYWCDNRTDKERQKVKTTLAQLRLLDFTEYAGYLENLFNYCQSMQTGWTNPKLIVPEVNLVSLAGKSFSERCQLIREQRGLTLTQAALYWDKSTQSRLESGISTLGVTDALLYGETMLDIFSSLNYIKDPQPWINLAVLFNAVNAEEYYPGYHGESVNDMRDKLCQNVESVTSPWREYVNTVTKLMVSAGEHQFNQHDYMMLEHFFNQKRCYLQDTIFMGSIIHLYASNLNLEEVCQKVIQMLPNTSVSVIQRMVGIFVAFIENKQAKLASDFSQAVSARVNSIMTLMDSMDLFTLNFSVLVMNDNSDAMVKRFVATEKAISTLYLKEMLHRGNLISQVQEVAPDVVERSGLKL